MRTLTIWLILLMAALPVLAQTDALDDANDLLEAGEYGLALDIFDKVLDDDAENVAALVGRAEAYVQLRAFEDALGDAKAALALDDENAGAYLWRGVANLGLENLDDAEADILQSIELDPDPEAYTLLAQVYIITGEPEQALESYADAIDAADTDEQAVYYYQRGQFRSQIGDLEGAIADYSAAIEQEPENADYYFSRSFAYFDLGQVEAAIEDDTRVIELAPDFASGHLNRGFHYYTLEDFGPASADYLTWIELLDGERVDLDPLEDNEDELDLTMETGTAYYLPFTAPRAAVIDVEAYSPRGGVDPVVLILNADGEPIMVDDDGGFGLSALLDGYNLPGAGEYTLVISHAGGGDTGRVTVEVEVRQDFGNV